MLRTTLFLVTLSFFQLTNAQKKTFKCKEVHDAIKLIDAEKYDEGISILKDCEKIDPKDYTYPYEIALAYIKKKDYTLAISELNKAKDHSNIDDYYYALLGSAYDLSNNPEKAISVYNEGLKKFPASGKLYLEKGVVLEFEGKFNEAIKTYEKGIKAEPSYPSNYYRVSQIYLNSNDLLSGLIYGEIFVNLERTTSRTKEISMLLYENYKKAVKFDNEGIKTNLCPAVIDAQQYDKNKKFPFCIVFAKNFALSIINQKEINLNTLSEIRRQFLKEYYTKDYIDNPNVLLSYHKTMEDHNVFNAYNHYIFQIGDQKAFKNWQENNKAEYDQFVHWYTTNENILNINKNNLFVSDQIKE
ncbi:hypothetical protein MP478_21620 [Chryseobacterium sp. WG14]|uniref:tetratricopeptide repeat protein n=1 Tax=unclassified Chryseobacterium TaxID=2593645 RepID=UPI001DA28534|nr:MULTISPECIES: tetratricopeptide repeat protein [unclassified Chryseobacterium]MCQ9637159.1 hypothetical protein [Chryseobacterium sp. WG23]MCQ9641990.1 hypothetical protein [Chryseobacterium sp. WG14]CAH0219943.1 Beta-barrel assembly-enhancing protease [Chryseobacterium sp. Bi04]